MRTDICAVVATIIALSPSSAAATGFQCVGGFSNVSFSSESGDGSGIVVETGSKGLLRYAFFEGSVSQAKVRNLSVTPTVIAASAIYDDDTETALKLTCVKGGIRIEGRGFGTYNLRRITNTRLASLMQQ